MARPCIRDWSSANAYLGAKDERPLPGRSTRLRRLANGDIAVRYHRTDVVVYSAYNIVVQTDGYHTLTTRARISAYTPISAWTAGGDGRGRSSGTILRLPNGDTVVLRGHENYTYISDKLAEELCELGRKRAGTSRQSPRATDSHVRHVYTVRRGI